MLRVSTQYYQGFHYNKETLDILMNAAIMRSPRRLAPKKAQEWLDTIEELAEVTYNKSIEPDTYTFIQVLKAWAESGLPEAGERMDRLVEYMRDRKKVPVSVVCFNILIRHWAREANTGHIQQLQDMMKEKYELEPSPTTLAHIVYGYTRAGKIEQAETLIRDMLVLGPQSEYEWDLVGQCTQQLLLAYRRIILSDKRNEPVKLLAADRAEKLYNHVHDQLKVAWRRTYFGNVVLRCIAWFSSIFSHLFIILIIRCRRCGFSEQKFTLTLLDMFLRTGQTERAESLVLGNVTPERVTLLFKAMGKHELAERVEQIFYNLVNQNQVEPDLKMLNALLKAWVRALDYAESRQTFDEFSLSNSLENNKLILSQALSLQPDLWDHALKIMDFLENHPRCSHLHPNQETYNFLLECLSVSKEDDTGGKAMEILHKMEELHREGIPNIRPNITSYNMTIRSCLQGGDEKLAVDLLQRMEESKKVLPDRSTFTEILNHLSEIATPEAGERAVEMIDRMRQNAINFGRKFLAPDVNCYNLAITTCTRVYRKLQDIVALERAWKLYQQMLSLEDRKRFVRPNEVTFTRLLTTFTKVKDAKWMERADEVLLEYAKCHYRGLQPSELHFDIVINGWNAIGETEQADSWGTVKVKVLKSISYNHPHHT
jgi:pentatricopeptide repeat protein